MASQETDKASAGGAQGSQVEPQLVNSYVYQPIEKSQNCLQGELQALGAIQILNGVMILALGGFLGSLQSWSHPVRHPYFFTFYTGYPLLGGVFFISSGSLSVAAGRKSTRKLMQNSFGMNIASAIIALVGIIFTIINLVINNMSLKHCSSQSPDLCIYMGSSSMGLVSLMLILTLLELCVSLSISVLLCKANCCNLREEISSPPNSVEQGMPPGESNSERKEGYSTSYFQ
ncbi:membrane-spanning 4-domains subfamily A member 3 [Dasypus novemcinctus]|uniref:membrane-spanning 4-domains subfamily A member 3 n=1 Tax=Dasypus novemcinctus TaxID=9361 RepID=UPI00032913E7|nr:membrane-spanning 4-domains subfamily A member 3 [Dasypus novemcinctus]